MSADGELRQAARAVEHGARGELRGIEAPFEQKARVRPAAAAAAALENQALAQRLHRGDAVDCEHTSSAAAAGTQTSATRTAGKSRTCPPPHASHKRASSSAHAG